MQIASNQRQYTPPLTGDSPTMTNLQIGLTKLTKVWRDKVLIVPILLRLRQTCGICFFLGGGEKKLQNQIYHCKNKIILQTGLLKLPKL